MRKLFLLSMVFLLLVGCADHVSITESVKNIEPVGFFYGFWHGLIAAFAFIVSLFSDDVAVYAVYNSGGWYDFGFLLGAGAFSSSTVSVKRK
jgi:hypothetical protein